MGYLDMMKEEEAYEQPQASYLDQLEASESDPWGLNTKPEWELDFGQRFETGIQESFATLWGGLGMMSDIVGLDSARDYTMGRSNDLFAKAAAHDIQTTSFKDIEWGTLEGVSDMSKFLTEGIIGVIPDIAGTMLGGAGVATGLAKVGGKAIIKKSLQKGAQKRITSLMKKGATKEVAYSTALKEIGGMAGVGGYTALTGAGGMYSTDYNMEGDETSPWAALGGGVAQGAITMFNPFSKVLAGIAAKKGATEIGKMAIGEALEEVSQGGIEQLHRAGIDPDLTVEQIFSDPDTYWQLAEAGVLGAFVGGVFGGIGTKLNSKEEAADLIKMGEEKFTGVTPPTDIQDLQEGDAVGDFKQDWKIAEAKLKLTNKLPADNTDMDKLMAEGAATITPPVTADPEVSAMEKESKEYLAAKNRVQIQPSFTEMTGDGTIKGAIDYLKNAETNTEMDDIVGAYQDADFKPVSVERFEAIVDRYRKAKNLTTEGVTPKPKTDVRIKESKVDELISSYKTPAERGAEKAIQEGKTLASEEEAAIERRTEVADPVDTKPTKTIEHLLQGTPDAAIAYIKSFGNSKKTLDGLRKEADAYIKDNPHLEMVIEDNFKEASQAAKVSRGIARDTKTAHSWSPYKVGGMEYGDWLQVEVDGSPYVMFKSPEHGNKFIISKTLKDGTPIKGTTAYKTKQEAKTAFEKVLPSVKGEKRTTKGQAKPLSYTKTGELDADGIPLMLTEGKGTSRSSDGEYKIVNTHGKHGKFFLYKGEDVLNEGVHFESLKAATEAYKAHRSTDPSALKVKQEKSGKPVTIRRKKGAVVEVAKAKRLAAKAKAKEAIKKQKQEGDTSDLDINVSESALSNGSITAHPTMPEKHAKLTAGIFDILGMDIDNVYVGPLGSVGNVHPNKAITKTLNVVGKSVMGRAIRHRSTGQFSLGLNLDAKLDDAQMTEVIAHEAFHIHQWKVLESLGDSDKKKIISIWADFIKKNPAPGVIKNKQERDAWLDTYFAPLMAGKIKQLMGENVKLDKGWATTVRSFTEWYSNQGAKYMRENKEGMSLILKTYKSLTSSLKKIYSFVTGKSPNTVDPEFKKWMDNLLSKKKVSVESGTSFVDIQQSDLELTPDQVRTGAKKAKDADYAMTEEDATAYFKKEADKPTKEKAKDKVDAFLGKALEKFDDLSLSINERLRKIHPRLRNFMMRYESSLLKWNNRDGKDVSPFLKKVLKLDEATQNELGMYLSNTNNKEDNAKAMKMIDELGLRKEYDKVDSTLEGIYDRAEDVGLNTEEKLDNFFPRVVKDMEGLTNYMLNNPKEAGPLTSIIESKLSEADKATAIQTFMNTNRLPPSMIKKTGSSMKRGIKRINPKMYKFYHSIEDTLQMHIEENNAKIEGRALLGVTNAKKLTRVLRSKKSTEAEKVEAKEELLKLNSQEGESDEDITKFLAKTGLSLNSKDQKLTLSLIRARLNQKGMSGMMGRVRDMGLISALGSPLNTLTQLGDLPLVLYKMGLGDTLKAMKTVAGKKGEVTYDQMNLSNVMKEFQISGTSKWVEKVLKYTGFAKVDQFFKEVYSQASIDKARKMSEADFITKYKAEYGIKGAKATYNKIQKGEVLNDDVLTFVLGEISEMQPVTLSEMPKGYLEAGNTRILYTLKSYSMKMLATMRREMLDEVKKGNYGQASKNFAMLIPMLVLSNAGIDELKDWIQGKEEPFSDNVLNNLLKLFLFSKYDMDKIGDKGPSEFLMKMLTPPISSPIDNMLRDAVNLFPGGDDATYASLANVPVVGRLAYKKSQEGRTKIKRGTKLSIREDIREALKSGDSLNSVRKRIAIYNRSLPKGTKKMPFSVISEIRKDIRRKKIEDARKN